MAFLFIEPAKSDIAELQDGSELHGIDNIMPLQLEQDSYFWAVKLNAEKTPYA